MQDSVRQDRNKYIGGSDIPVIMGISPFKKRYDLLREKCGLQEDTFEGNEYTRYGEVMEPKIRDFINSKELYEEPFVEGKHFAELFIGKDLQPDIETRCHTDGENSNTVLEIKTTSQIFENVDDYQLYLVQLLYYMLIAQKPFGILAVYERPEDMSEEFTEDRLHLYPICSKNYNNLNLLIGYRVQKFLEDRRKLLENPFLTEQELLPKEIALNADKMLVLEQKLAGYKKIQEEYEKQRESLLKAMQEAGVPTFETSGGYKITVVDATAEVTTTETVVNADKLKEKHPRIYKEVAEQVTHTKKGRKAYLRITAPKEDKE